jgi:hypothetical protein
MSRVPPAKRIWVCRFCWTGEIPNAKRNCPTCGRPKKAKKKPAHQLILETPYEAWVAAYGERCGVCGRPPGPGRRLDRDHDHRTGEPRGLLCHRCNRALPNWVTPDWLYRAIAYLLQPRRRLG